MLLCFPWTDSTLRIGQVEADRNGFARTWINFDNFKLPLMETCSWKCLMVPVFRQDRCMIYRKELALKSNVSSFCLPKCYFCDQSDCKIFPTVKVDIWKYKKRDRRDKVFKNGPSKIFWRLSSTNFTWSILWYFVPYD